MKDLSICERLFGYHRGVSILLSYFSNVLTIENLLKTVCIFMQALHVVFLLTSTLSWLYNFSFYMFAETVLG